MQSLSTKETQPSMTNSLDQVESSFILVRDDCHVFACHTWDPAPGRHSLGYGERATSTPSKPKSLGDGTGCGLIIRTGHVQVQACTNGRCARGDFPVSSTYLESRKLVRWSWAAWPWGVSGTTAGTSNSLRPRGQLWDLHAGHAGYGHDDLPALLFL